MSWWTETSAQDFTAVASARHFAEVDGLHRRKVPSASYVPNVPSLEACSTCPRGLSPSERTKGLTRCRWCRKATPGIVARRKAA